MNFKKILYYGSVVCPIINNIYKAIKVIYEFNKGNSEILKARDDIKNSVKYLQEVIGEIRDFQRLNDEDN